LFVEIWDSAEAQQAYLGWRVESGFIDAVSGDLAGAPVIRTFEIRDDI
jgi:quinol monooxygenase YgiN